MTTVTKTETITGTNNTTRVPTRPWTIGIIFAFLALSLWHLHVLNRLMAGRSDLTSPYFGTRAALTGHNPYSSDTTRQIQLSFFGRVLPGKTQAFAYPIYTAFILAPIAWMPLWGARLFYTVFTSAALAISVPLWFRIAGLRPSSTVIAPCVGLSLVSWPVIIALRHQQLSLLIPVLICASCILLCKNYDLGAGLLLGIATIKPQLTLICIPWLLIWAGSQRRWRFCFASLASTAGLCLAGDLLLRSWVTDWLAALRDYRVYTASQPSLQEVLGKTGLIILFLLGALSIIALWKARKSAPASPEFCAAVSLSLAMAVCLYPTNIHWIYNQVALIPGCLFLFCFRPRTLIEKGAQSMSIFFIALPFVLLVLATLVETLSKPSFLTDFLPYENPLLPFTLSVYLLAFLLGSSRPRQQTLFLHPEVLG